MNSLKEQTLQNLEDTVSTMLRETATDSEKLYNTVLAVSKMPIYNYEITPDDISLVVKRLETRFDISMSIGSLLQAEDYSPWLDHARGEIDWHYWNNYKRYLSEKGFSKNVISTIDIDTDNILDRLENPKKDGSWSRKGLVVGHVQSGKTANYSGLITKAADSGYRVIIVLAGILNALRNQTQERIDEGFIGLDSSKQLDKIDQKKKRIGVGTYLGARTPVPLTTSTQDFDKKIATQLRTQLGHFNEPIILVLKKNVSILENLIDWLKGNNDNIELSKVPMLLIDDEADNASVNTNKEEEDPTSTNKLIRELLGLFDQSCYLGYTATPFANIFIDPNTEDEMLKDDLYPRDFIISLEAPSNYIGANRIFGDKSDLSILREVDDYKDVIPLKHKKDDLPDTLPASLYVAIRMFILIKASRNLRGQRNSHNSMLINISRFTDVQSRLKILVHEYLSELRDSISNHYALSPDLALKNTNIFKLKGTWEKELSSTEFSWEEIQSELKDAVSPISVIEVNGSRDSELLDYNFREYPKGRNLIAVGGLSLSRGLTLEGLTVSYFLRNSIMYDTLMQMGRWFGYRTNYEDLCRIYMSGDAISWYSHISKVTDELRTEFKKMEAMGVTPSEYGLSVRRHPESLIVTARNKMRSSTSVVVKIDLEGRLIETSVLSNKKSVIENNWLATSELINSAKDSCQYENFSESYLFKKCPVAYLDKFLHTFTNHPGSPKTSEGPIIEYMNWLANSNTTCKTWDILLLNKVGSKSKMPPKNISGFTCQPEQRTVSLDDLEANGSIAGKKRRFGSDPDQAAGVPSGSMNDLIDTFGSKSDIPSSEYRKVRLRPLLILHILDCQVEKLGDKSTKRSIKRSISDNGIISYEISFPGVANSRSPKKLVEYEANVVYWNQHFGDIEDV